jgi:hypothetical protein
MIDRVLNLGPVQQESYYFQLIPISLSIVNKDCELPAKDTTYKYLVFKGTSPPIQASKGSMRTRSPSRPPSKWSTGPQCCPSTPAG